MTSTINDSTDLHGKTGNIYLIGCLLRPGSLKFATELEHTYFCPDSDDNDLYNIYRLSYCKLPYYIIEIPVTSFKIAEKLATLCNLKLVNGKPYNSKSGPFRLTCSADSCFTLEAHDNYVESGSLSEILHQEHKDVKKNLLK